MEANMTEEEKQAHWKKFRYRKDLPEDLDATRRLMEVYSKIPADQVDKHFFEIRDKAWAIHPYPCIGRFTFLELGIAKTPYYQEALQRLNDVRGDDSKTSPEGLLDLGCCFGQVLRQFASEGVDPRRLYGADLEQDFIDLGYKLFNDTPASAPFTFVSGNLLDTTPAGPYDSLKGAVTMVHAANFFHLFLWADQVTAAKRIVSFLIPCQGQPSEGQSSEARTQEEVPKLAVFGSHVACTVASERSMLGSKQKRFLHDAASFQALWDEVGEATGTRWKTVVKVVKGPEEGQARDPEGDLTYVQYGVYWA